MMMKMLWVFLILLLSVWAGAHLRDDPGYVLITFHHWTVETTLLVGALLLVFVLVVGHLLISLLAFAGHCPASLARWRAKRRALASQSKTRQGLIEFSEGHWSRAKKYLIKGLPDADMPLVNYLTAARAAQEMGDPQLRDDFLREAQQCMPDAKIAVELTQAQLQLANRQWEQALATLRHLKDIAPNHTYVLKLLADLYQEVKDWPQLIGLLPDLKRYRVVTGRDYEQLQEHAYLQGLIDIIKQDKSPEISIFFNTLPKPLTDKSAFVAVYCQYLLKEQDEVDAEVRLRQCLRTALSDDLLDLYGALQPEAARIDFIESLLKKNTHSATLYLCLGRLCKKNQLWGKAKTYLEASLQLSPTPTAYAELADLLETLDDHPAAFTLYRKGLLLATQER
jgi:HemY protein